MDAKLKNFSLVFNEAYIKNNNLPEGDFQLIPQIQRKIGKLDKVENTYVVEARVEIHHTNEHPFPIELIASISGIFNIEGDDLKKINEFLQIQGFQMVFPHLRALVANMTANAMVPSILLPILSLDQFVEQSVNN